MIIVDKADMLAIISKEYTVVQPKIIFDNNVNADIGLMILKDCENINNLTIQLQFNTISDIEYLQEKLDDLKKEMRLVKEYDETGYLIKHTPMGTTTITKEFISKLITTSNNNIKDIT